MTEKEYIKNELESKEQELDNNERERSINNLKGVLLTCLSIVGVVAAIKAYLPVSILLAAIGGTSALRTYNKNALMKEESEKINQEIDHLEKIEKEGIDSSLEKQIKRNIKMAKLQKEINALDTEVARTLKDINTSSSVTVFLSLLGFLNPLCAIIPLNTLILGVLEGTRAIELNEELQNRKNRFDNLQVDVTAAALKEQAFAEKKKNNPKLIREIPKLKTKDLTKENENSEAVDKYVESLANTEEETTAKKLVK